ncbi:MAG: hypothetical protein ACI9S8_002950 [Chlamydiales bacterium]|jgi:hypothetical protein
MIKPITYLLTLSLAFSSCTTFSSSNSQNTLNLTSKEPRCIELFPSQVIDLPLDLAIPEGYEVDRLPSDFHLSRDLDIADGVLWGKRADLNKIRKVGIVDGVEEIKQGVFMVKISQSTAQTGANSFSGEEKLPKILEGMKNAKLEKLSWGEFPVIAISYEGELNELPTLNAFIGTNYAGFTLQISYVPTKDNSTHASSFQIWRTFLEQTKMLPRKEFLKVYGVEMEKGWSAYHSRKAIVEGRAEKRRSDGQIRVLLNKNAHCMNLKVSKTSRCTVVDFPSDESVKLHMTIKKSNLTNTCVMTICPNVVDDFSNNYKINRAKTMLDDSANKVLIIESAQAL